MSKYRYPGLLSYTKNDEDIFKGRDKEAKALFSKVSLNQTLVLHAESGTGKSSLVQAGLFPLLEKAKEKYIPVTIRLSEVVQDNTDNLLVSFTLRQVQRQVEKLEMKVELPVIFVLDDQAASLWKYSKILEKAEYKLVLIFDQFEHLQTFWLKQREPFIDALYDFINPKMPAEIFKAINDAFPDEQDSVLFNRVNEVYSFLDKPSTAKLLFVVREDKLGVMSLLSDCFPDILKNDYIIKPLSQDDAICALTVPAKAKGNYDSPIFEFESNGVVLTIIENLKDKETGSVDPIQLQTVASDLEKNVVLKLGKTLLSQGDIPDPKIAFQRYYQTCWDEAKKEAKKKIDLSEEEFQEVKKRVITTLLTDGRRDLVASNRLKRGKVSTAIVEELEAQGFLREIPHGNNEHYYQLTHDRLIDPIQTDINAIKADEDNSMQLAVAKEAADIAEKKAIEERENAEKQRKEADVQRERAEAEAKARQRAGTWLRVAIVALCASVFASGFAVLEWQKAKRISNDAVRAKDLTEIAKNRAETLKKQADTLLVSLSYQKRISDGMKDSANQHSMDAKKEAKKATDALNKAQNAEYEQIKSYVTNILDRAKLLEDRHPNVAAQLREEAKAELSHYLDNRKLKAMLKYIK